MDYKSRAMFLLKVAGDPEKTDLFWTKITQIIIFALSLGLILGCIVGWFSAYILLVK